MNKLQELFIKVKEENLNKYQLEDLYKEMSEIKADMLMEYAEIEKKEAIFMLKDPEKTGVAKKREWKGTAEGLRGIELKAMIRAVSTHLSSIKGRLYITY